MDQVSQENFETRKSAIVNLVSEGQGSVKKASEVFSVTPQGVRKICAKAGLDMIFAKTQLHKNIAQAIDQGTAKSDVYAKFGVGASTVKEACETHGVPFTAQGCNPEQVLKILSDLMNSADPLSLISRKHSVSPYLVSRIYLKAISNGIPLQKRKPGKPAHVSVALRVCIPLDNAIDASPETFSLLTHSLFGRAEIHILVSPSVGPREKIEQELNGKNIKYDRLTLSDDRLEYLTSNQIDVFFETEDFRIQNVPSNILVLKVRDGENFCFDTKKWLYSSRTGELV